MPERIYGEIPGYPPDSTFVNRRALSVSRVHRPLQSGICGGQDGAESIVVSGGYVDDEDLGIELIYTGQGGRDPVTRRQIADQTLTLGNAGLAVSRAEGYPVRVIRGAGGDPRYSPVTGLRYDGLFRVVDFWHEEGVDGPRVWRFRLLAIDRDFAIEAASPSVRATATVQRLVRSLAVARRVKELHEYSCQVCGLQIPTPAGLYAEAAHIRGLGRPHDGPDVESNVLCLCPNHHVMFDLGAIYVDEQWMARQSADHAVIGPVRRSASHSVDGAQLAYHRAHHAP